jgi:Helix-turn-helix domain
VRRAKAVLAVNAGEALTVAAALSGFTSADSVSQLVGRFNQQGLAALSIAAGRGRQPTNTSS